MDESLTDPRCVASVDALVLDGANGVCRDARLGPRDEVAWRGGALALAVLIALAILVRARHARVVIAGLALALALPGLVAMATERADRPAQVTRSAAQIAALHGSLRAFATRNGCARVSVARCLTCEPIARLALTGLSCDGGAAIELREGALERGCEERGATLVCGAP